MLWITREMLSLKRRRHCRFFQSDFCLWGMPWRKATGFLAGFCNPSRAERICQNGTCKRNGCHHLVLAGVEPVSKMFWTHIAEAYPRSLSAALAKMLHEARLQLLHNENGARLNF